MISQSAGHRRSDQDFSPEILGGGQPPAQFVMGVAKVVRAANQPHSGFEQGQPTSRVSAAAAQARQALSHGPIEAFDESRVQHLSSSRMAQHLVGPLNGSLRHASDYFDHALLGRLLDHRSNEDLWPRLQHAPPAPSRLLDLVAKRASNTVGVR